MIFINASLQEVMAICRFACWLVSLCASILSLLCSMMQLTEAVIAAFQIMSKDTEKVVKTTIVAVQLMIDDVIEEEASTPESLNSWVNFTMRMIQSYSVRWKF